ncbi:hypothetical protein CYPRO_2468 [Cyclonatronum proteinivorum]|uniref:Uncharacterized protein n=1 Tax=Cyclonatronum proteinivorum TaxID=1457365 RepID=A0A345UMK8_9BACT|nr:hypothetical protein CYPRO_2468 [Cyclonatronum proteinivorum]
MRWFAAVILFQKTKTGHHVLVERRRRGSDSGGEGTGDWVWEVNICLGVCGLPSHSLRTFPTPRAMAFRGVPGVRARHTPPVRCAHPGTPLKRGILRFLRRRYIVVSLRFTFSDQTRGLRSLIPRDPSTPLRSAQDDRGAGVQTARLAAPGF